MLNIIMMIGLGTWVINQGVLGADGQPLSSGNIANAQGLVTFTVDNLSLAGYGYQPGDNHDPDGESDGTTVTLAQ